MRVRGVLGMSVVAVVLAAAGCSPDDPDPPPTSSAPTTSAGTESPTDTVTATPTVTVPELPEAATVGDAAGAEAFVQHWVDVLNYGYQSGDSAPLAGISEDGCKTCQNLITVIDDRASDGSRLEGGLAAATLVRSPPPENGIVSVSLQLAQSEGQLVSSDGEIEVIAADPPANLGFIASFESGGWMLAGIGTE